MFSNHFRKNFLFNLPMSNLYQNLFLKKASNSRHFVLLDPGKLNPEEGAAMAIHCEQAGVDALLVGGSFLDFKSFHSFISSLKDASNIPVILFPGEAQQLSPAADAILYISLLSGRNARFLVEEQIKAAPYVKEMGLEVIPTGYLLIESGAVTAVERASSTKPLPRENADLIAQHALGGQYLGFRSIYLEAGSGAKVPVPESVISRVKKEIDLPLIAGGGITSPELAQKAVKAGADIIVTGNIFEEKNKEKELEAFVQAIHT
jgi:phosphoglycerol geranylgeranyltransferase